MSTATKTPLKKATKSTATKVQRHLDDQPLELLSSKEYEAITAANYEHPEARIILRLFLHVNYFLHVSRFMQGLPSNTRAVDWKTMEQNSAQTIRNTFEKLLLGVDTSAWNGRLPDKYKKV